jgi:myo-inositol-1(or 4)-monophosphatase
MNTAEIKSTLLEALNKAGVLMRSAIDAPKEIELKAEYSLVTKTDMECDRLIIETVRSRFPDHAFLTEESPASGNSASRWIVDPIDGTTNFAHGYPVSCVSIGFEHDGKMLMGGVYDPFRNELFFAEKGKGAFLNDKPIRVSKTKTLEHALLSTGFPYDIREHADEYLTTFKEFLLATQGIRRAGAAALDLCYVACGRFDAYYEKNLQAWDKAAGMLIVEEAGGKITNYDDKPLTLTDRANLASNGSLHAAMLNILKKYI